MSDPLQDHRSPESTTQASGLEQLLDGGLRQELGLEPEDLTAALAVANAKMKSGDAASALKIYQALVLCDPLHYPFLQGLANAALKTEYYEAALEMGAAMITLQPDNGVGYYFSAGACLALGHMSEAREDVTDALAFAEKAGDEHLMVECRRLFQKLEQQ